MYFVDPRNAMRHGAITTDLATTVTYSAYVTSNTYSTGDRVSFGGAYFEAKKSVPTNNTPPEFAVWCRDNDFQSDEYWDYLGHANYTALFNQVIENQSTTDSAGGSITAEASFNTTYKADQILNTVSFLNMENISSIEITVTHGIEGVVYDETIDTTDNISASDPYEWAYILPSYKRNVYLFDLPHYYASQLEFEIVFNAASGKWGKVGSILFGTQLYIGSAKYGSTCAFSNYDRKIKNTFNSGAYISRQYFSKKHNYNLFIDNNKAEHLVEKLTVAAEEPTLFFHSSAETDRQYAIYGRMKSFDFNFAVNKANYTLSVEEFRV